MTAPVPPAPPLTTLEQIAEALAEVLGLDPALADQIVQAIASLLGAFGGELTTQRKAAIDALGQAAAQGYRNAAGQLYNWAHKVGAAFPHGNEPSGTLEYALAAWNTFASAHPAWAALFTGGTGAPGDPILEAGGPSLPAGG